MSVADAEHRLTNLFEDHYGEILAYCTRRIGASDAPDSPTEDMTIAYRGGRTHSLTFDVSFAADAGLNTSFMEFAREQPGLFNEREQPVWNTQTGALWVAAAEAFGQEG